VFQVPKKPEFKQPEKAKKYIVEYIVVAALLPDRQELIQLLEIYSELYLQYKFFYGLVNKDQENYSYLYS
jgi:hypothetical protein